MSVQHSDSQSRTVRRAVARATAVTLIAMALLRATPRAQVVSLDPKRQAYDELLDLNVRDGLVYYRALRGERAKLDAYIGSLATAPVDAAAPAEQMAFWINAYNAVVLQTVVSHYPIAGSSREYPPQSIRQIPGAFERTTHRLGGRTVTLDQIEQTILPGFHDPRVFFALGRGAMGSGRLRSEAYAAGLLERQLTEAADECASRGQCMTIDTGQDRLRVSAIFSWRQKEFEAALADRAPAALANRSPIERAVVALIGGKLFGSERELLMKNEFKMEYIPFDWSLNDLTGRGGR